MAKAKKFGFNPVDPHPNFPKLEEEVLQFWEDHKIFEKSLEKNRPKTVIPAKAGIQMDPRVPPSPGFGRAGKPEDEKHKLFTFYDGPPFATGLPHYGHILASTIKDLVPRYQTMKGRYVRRRWGWDCHGLPIEEIVERELKISGKKEIEKIGIKKFNETCRTMVLQYVAEWKKMVRRIGRWTEFDNSYKTMDKDYMESVWWGFKEIYDKGLVYEGRKVLLYCPRCETPISNFEVAMDNSYKDVTEEAVTVKFKIKNSTSYLPRRQAGQLPATTYMLAWTTTPWTLPGNIALAVGKDIDYVVAEKNGEQYLVAKDRLNIVIPDLIGDPGKIIKGEDLVGVEYEPLFDIPEMKLPKSYKVYAADFVNIEEGTGIVHTAVVYGEDDYALGIKEGLPVVPLLDEKGVFNELAPELIKGQSFKEAEKIIKHDLESRGLLFERKQHQHSYPHCWRCGTTLYYNAIPAWFVNISKIKKQMLKSNEKEISWFPEHLKLGRYAKSVEAAPDWNISRNRYWGNPMPVWKCAKCKKETVVGSVKELKEKAISGFSDNLDLHRPHIDKVILECEHCGGKAERITEIFDSWVEAGSMPFAEFHYPFENEKIFKSRFPAQFVTEYIAQTRAWFYVMHAISVVLFKKAPFENVVTTGTILAEDGSKMSKSKRNFPDPWEVIEKYGVDSLRFYLMNSVVMQADNLNFSEKDLATIYRKNVLILWNVYNYFVTYANEAKWEFDQKVKAYPKVTNILDEWILARLVWLTGVVSKYLDEYNTVGSTREIERFVNDLSTWYLRRSRGRNDGGFFSTFHHVLVELSKIIAPVTPYISELIYRNLTGKESVHLADWPEFQKLSTKQSKVIAQMSELRGIVEQVHAMRAKSGIKLRQKLRRLTIPAMPTGRQAKAGIQGMDPRVPPSPGFGRAGKPEDDTLLNILRDEVNVQEVVFGDKLELDINITPELKIEGLARELERQIQALRKASGLKIGEIIDLYYQTNSAIIEQAINKVNLKKVYVSQISKIKDQKSKLNTEKEINLEGETLRLKF